VSCNPSHFPLQPLLLCFQSLPLLPFSLSPLSPLPQTTERISPLADELAFTVETWNQFVRKVLMINLRRRNFNFFIRKSSQIYCSVQTNLYLPAAMCEACGQLVLTFLLLVGLLVHTYIIRLYHIYTCTCARSDVLCELPFNYSWNDYIVGQTRNNSNAMLGGHL